MPSRFANGKMTYKYDLMSNGEVIAEMDRLLKETKALSVELESRDLQFKEIGSKMDAMKTDQHEINEEINELYERVTVITCRIDDYSNYIDAFDRVAHSALFRFLNFFGQWYIYGYNGEIYPNELRYANLGKVPLLTRIKRGFRRIFRKSS